jgi:hypothetical protein
MEGTNFSVSPGTTRTSSLPRLPMFPVKLEAVDEGRLISSSVVSPSMLLVSLSDTVHCTLPVDSHTRRVDGKSCHGHPFNLRQVTPCALIGVPTSSTISPVWPFN